jgi:hypothetical protein
MNDTMFTVFPFIFFIMFILIAGLFIVSIIKGIGTWSHNNAQPKLTVIATIVAKRENVSTHMHNNGDKIPHNDTSTTYYVTFEVESGDRMEFSVSGHEYGLLVEEDKGELSFQGSRYLGFIRKVNII